MAKYIAITCDKETVRKHNLVSVIPRRQTEIDGTSRKRPSLAFLDTDTYTRVSNGVSEKNVPKWNWEEIRSPSVLQKKRLLALALMEIARTILSNHIYQFNGTIFRQRSGGPIGDNFTNLASQLVMYVFSRMYKAKLTNLRLYDKVVLHKIYVDD